LRKFFLIKGYLHYWLHAVNRHSLQPPFVYDFYTKVIAHDYFEPVFKQIESYRKSYLQDHSKITVNSLGATSHLTHQKERKISSIARHSLSSAKFSRFLYRLVHKKKAKVILELGTSLGINTLYLSAANPEAKIYTLEGCMQTAELAKKLFNAWHLKNIVLIEGNIDQTLHGILSQVPAIDLVYLDANHRFNPTVQYYKILHTKFTPDSIFVLDDIYWSSGMHKAWKYLIAQPEVSLSLDIFDAGLLFFRPMHQKQHYRLMF
jgi:predicted O-methyltransferase YrrM